MGLSVSASFAILSVSLFIGVAAFIEAAESTLSTLENGVEKKVDRVVDRARTNFQITNASLNGTGVSMNLTNTGSTMLAVTGVSVVINGTCADENVTNTTVEGKVTNLWAPGEGLKVELNCTAMTGERICVVTGNAVKRYGTVA